MAAISKRQAARSATLAALTVWVCILTWIGLSILPTGTAVIGYGILVISLVLLDNTGGILP